MLIAQDSGRVVGEELHELGIHAPLVGGVGWARHAQGVVECKTIKINHCRNRSAILVGHNHGTAIAEIRNAIRRQR